MSVSCPIHISVVSCPIPIPDPYCLDIAPVYYIVLAGRPLGTRVKEHDKEVGSIRGTFTRVEKQGQQASAINLQPQIVSPVRTMQ